MRLGRQMHDRLRLEALNNCAHRRLINDISLNELVTGVRSDALQRFQIASVGQLVDVEHFVGGVFNQVTDQSRTNETGTAGD